MAVVEDRRAAYEVAPDGKFRCTYHYRATVLRGPGVAQLAEFSDSYYDPYGHVTIKRALVIGPGGQVTVVGQDNIKDLPKPAEDGFYYQNLRLVVISFPQLEVGATVEVDLESSQEAPPMDGAFSLLEPLQGDLPRLRQSIRVTLPASMPLAWKLCRGSARYAREERDGRVSCQWEVGPQPQLVEEPAMPSGEDVAPVLALSTISSWKTISRWYAGLCQGSGKLTPALAGLAAELTAGKAGREDRIQALFRWTASHIRYVQTAYTGEKAGFQPAPAQLTLDRKYGVCRDKALFLVTLLRAIGEEAHMVLINLGAGRDPAVPCLWFDHAIVAIRGADGAFRFLDPTAEYSRQCLPARDQGREALVCTAQGEELQTTPQAPAGENRLDLALETVLGADGSLAAKVRMAASGHCDQVLRQELAPLAPAGREAWFAARVGRAFPGAVVQDLRLPDLDDLGTPLQVSFTLALPGQGIRIRNSLVFTTPGQGGSLDPVLASLLPEAMAPRRRHPLELDAPVASHTRETVALPAGYRILALPGPVALQDGAAALARSCVAVPEGLVYTEDFSAAQRSWSGPAYQGLRRILDRRARLRDGKVILVRPEGRP